MIVAEKVYGQDVSALKGKSTRKKPKKAHSDVLEIDIPDEMTEKFDKLTLFVDVMFVNGIPFLTTIDDTIRYRVVIPLENLTNDAYYEAFDKISRLYNLGQHQLKYLKGDGAFKSIFDPVADELDLITIYEAPDDHQSEAERNNRTIKERIRAVWAGVPYKIMQRL